MKKGMVLGLALIMGAIIVAPAPRAEALSLSDSLKEIKTTTQNAVQGTNTQSKTSAEKLEQQKQELETRRQAIEARIAEKRAAIKEKLSGPRQERCESKQVSINQILDTRADTAQRHFDRFKSIQDKLAAFVQEKGLDVENAAALELIMSDAQTAAQAAVTALAATDFNCKDTDSAAPGAIVMDEFLTAKHALISYRDSIKDYAVAVKTAASTVTETAEGTAQ